MAGRRDIREITDKDGNTLVKYSYDAWGNPTTVILSGTKWSEESQEEGDPSPTAQDDSEVVQDDNGDVILAEAGIQGLAEMNPYRYSSYRYDTETGLYYILM